MDLCLMQPIACGSGPNRARFLADDGDTAARREEARPSKGRGIVGRVCRVPTVSELAVAGLIYPNRMAAGP